METVQMEGERQITCAIEVYNLDVAIAVGYRVNSIKATHFRIWATKIFFFMSPLTADLNIPNSCNACRGVYR
ncbi:MAG: virulence RhuM family protein [Verrucomicrobia bacterium]|nr:virulence RhuM family protein [Verrucomicrobiota bacterium]